MSLVVCILALFVASVTAQTLGNPVRCGNSYYRIANYTGFTFPTWPTAKAFAESQTLTGLPDLCGQPGRLGTVRTDAIDTCLRNAADTAVYGTSGVWLGGTRGNSANWAWPSIDSCSGDVFYIQNCTNPGGASCPGGVPIAASCTSSDPNTRGVCQPGFPCRWVSDQPDGYDCNENRLQAVGGGWNDLSDTYNLIPYVLIEFAACGATDIGASLTVNSVPPGTITTYRFNQSNGVLNINLGAGIPAATKVRIDANGQTGGVVTLSGTTNLRRGLEFVDTFVGSAVTQVVVIGAAGAQISSLILSGSSGVTLSGSLIFIPDCGLSGIVGTLARGVLSFNGATITDPTNSTNVQVNAITGNYYLNASSISVNSFLVVTAANDAQIICSNSRVVAATSASVSLNGRSWSSVSVGLASTAAANTVAVDHLDLNGCSFEGPSRGYFNYFNGQVSVSASSNVLASNFTFGGKLRIRAYDGSSYHVRIVNSNLNMRATGTSNYLSLGNPKSGYGASSGSTGTLTFRNSVAVSAGQFEAYGFNIDATSSDIRAANTIVFQVVPPP